ncbi:hypothetical protein BVI2075_220002 [Burkholderia vietnamiensis]|nr:hypothetical protein BVI2075_220002 [Burkholderia vietnamiensis]
MRRRRRADADSGAGARAREAAQPGARRVGLGAVRRHASRGAGRRGRRRRRDRFLSRTRRPSFTVAA